MMRHTFTLQLVLIAAMVAGGCGRLNPGDQASNGGGSGGGTYMDKAAATGDLVQEPQASLPNQGKEYCGPVSTSNALMWLAANGFPELVGNSAQIDVAKTLGSEKYMNTDPNNGTPPTDVMNGLQAYVADHGGYKISIQYEGWRDVPAAFSTGEKHPQISWAQDRVHGPTGFLINVGWYTHEGQEYKRHGGHWVTLVGYEPNPKSGILSLAVHNPLPTSGERVHDQLVTWKALDAGKMTGDSKNLPLDTAGYLEADGLLENMKPGHVAIIDGMVAFALGN